jgi:hypothetical protein
MMGLNYKRAAVAAPGGSPPVDDIAPMRRGEKIRRVARRVLLSVGIGISVASALGWLLVTKSTLAVGCDTAGVGAYVLMMPDGFSIGSSASIRQMISGVSLESGPRPIRFYARQFNNNSTWTLVANNPPLQWSAPGFQFVAGNSSMVIRGYCAIRVAYPLCMIAGILLMLPWLRSTRRHLAPMA